MTLSTDDFENWKTRGTKNDATSKSDVDLSGIPLLARLRIEDHNRAPNRAFTTSFSVNELLLASKMQIQPICQVSGTSVYHVGWQSVPFWNNEAYELMVPTQARLDAWNLAFDRLLVQARGLDAQGVVGMHLSSRTIDKGLGENSIATATGNILDVSILGTAVRHGNRPSTSNPYLSTLSGQDIYALDRVGYEPAGIAYGVSVYYQPSYWSTRYGNGGSILLGAQWNNQELTDFTRGYTKAFHLALERMQVQALGFGGHGILGFKMRKSLMEIEQDYNEQKQVGLILTFEMVGTVIRQAAQANDSPISVGVSLNDSISPSI